MKKRFLAAIDAGTTKICTVLADVSEEEHLRLIGVGIGPSKGFHKGLVANLVEARRSIVESVRMAEQSSGHHIESAVVSVAGRHITSANSRGVVAITRPDGTVRPDDVRRVIDVARTVNVPREQRVIHIMPRDYIVDGQGRVKNPVGMHGMRLDVETHIISVSASSLQNLEKCVRSAGVDVADFVMGPLAAAEAVLRPEEKEDGVLVADIGGGATGLAVFKENTVYHTATLPVAGYQVTRDVSIGLGVTYDIAEELKKKYADLTPAAEDTAAVSGNGDGTSVSVHDLNEIIRCRFEELFQLIVMELPASGFSQLIPSGLVITGGCANLPGIADLARRVTHLPVRIGAPEQLPGLYEGVAGPAFSTSVGLLLWHLHNAADDLHRDAGNGLDRLVSRVSRLVH